MTAPESDPRPLLVVTVLLDQSARAAAITRAHGDAMERAFNASTGFDIAGMELAELPISPKAFAALRKNLSLADDTVALYDLFPISSQLDPGLRRIAGQFLAAEALWALEEQGITDGVPPAERFDLPKGWTKDPKDIRNRLVEAGATQLGSDAVQTFAQVKSKWDALAASA